MGEESQKGTGKNGYVWYGDQVGGGPDGWADMGRTGTAGIANFLSPYADPVYRERALFHAKVIGKHPQSFPDTHGSPAMGMAYTTLGANVDPDSFRKLMDANRWWFTMAQCTDGSFYYQPNRDNAGYGSDSRMTASSVVAFIFAIPKHSLVITGKEANALKPHDKSVSAGKPVKVFILAGQSNMEGQGFIKADPKRNGGKGRLEYLVKDQATAETLNISKAKRASGSPETTCGFTIGIARASSRWVSGQFTGRAYERVGFGWHQGWNDRVNRTFNDEYERNLANFIHDIRKDLGMKSLPFVIAETGMSGKEEKHPRALSLITAQAAVAEYEEFEGNVAFVGTREFWRDKDVSPTGQAYHWNTNAETYYLIGEAMGNAMKKPCAAKPPVN